jgi:hypothetical protein
MSEVLIPYGDNASDTATLLLGAAEDLELDPGVVRNQPDDGGFRVPEEVADKAGLGEPDEEPKKKTSKKASKKTASNG